MGREVATKDDSELDAYAAGEVAEGLEDVDAGDILLPIIKINHTEGVFQDSLSNARFDEFPAVILGLVKNRILWPSQIEEDNEGKQPICRSLDFKFGRPNPERFTQKDISGQFPSKVSKFGKDRITRAMEAIEEDPVGADLDDLLPCASCNLKEWETMPGGKTPWCSEQYIFPILRITEDGGFAPAYITFQRAALKDCRSYISYFKGMNKPMYTQVTTISAVVQRRGNVQYVTPRFEAGAPTDPSNWPDFSINLNHIRTFLTTPRPPRESTTTTTETDDDDDDVQETPAPAPKSKAKKGEVIEATVVEDDDDEPTPSAKAKQTVPPAPAEDDDDDEEEPF